MAKPFEELSGLDRLVHEPARLAVLTALMACRRADFTFLQHLTGLTQGNLSTHLSKLERAKLVRIDKRFVGKKPNTRVALTGVGRKAIEEHWSRLEELRTVAMEWDPSTLATEES